MNRPLPVKLRRYEWILGAIWLLVQQLLLADGLKLLGLGGDAVMLNGAFYLLSVLITAGIFWRLLTDSLGLLRGEPGRLLRGLLLGFCLYEFVQVGLGILYQTAFPALETPNDDSIRALAETNFPLVAAITVLMSPLIEETLYRGLIFGGIREKSRLGAYIASALIFACAHLLDYVGRTDPVTLLLNLPLYVLPGAALCACYERSGNLWAPVLLHMGINAVAMIALGN